MENFNKKFTAEEEIKWLNGLLDILNDEKEKEMEKYDKEIYRIIKRKAEIISDQLFNKLLQAVK